MLTKLLNRFAQPQNSRDHRAVAIVVRGLDELMWLTAGSLVAGAYGVTVWDSRMGHVLVEVAGAAIVVGLVHGGSVIRRLRREMVSRALCRKKRLALPHVLADGISAAERMDIRKTAEAITFRVQKSLKLDERSLAVFDVLLSDILSDSPRFAQNLREWGERHRRKA